MRRRLEFLFLLLLLQATAALAAPAKSVKVDWRQTVLKNGLKVITVEDHAAPVIALSVTYDVGSRVEGKGMTGFAHLFEHMMFKGSQNVGSGEHFVLVFNNGGTMNGTTSEDRTNYFEALPSNQLDLLLFLESENPEKDIALYINSPGGSVSAGLAIYDTMQFIKPDVSTICVGMAASMGAVLLAGGAKGKRFMLPNSRAMIHQPSGGFQGQASDIHIQAQEILKIRGRLNEILARHTGQTVDKIALDSERDNFMSPTEAVAYGLVDKLLDKRVAPPTTAGG